MTMSVKQNSRRTGSQWQIELRREFFEQQARFGYRLCLLPLLSAQERRRIVLDRRKATRFAKQDLFSAAGDGEEAFYHTLGVRARFGQQTLRNQWAPATAGPDHSHTASAAFQYLNGGDPDLG